MALVVLMCLCGCAGCGANRYRYYRRGNGYHNLMSYSSYSNEGMQQRHKNHTRELFSIVSMDRRNRRNRNRQGRSSRTQRTTNYNSAGPTANNNVATETQYVLPQNGERPPPYAAAIPSAPAPPPYSYYWLINILTKVWCTCAISHSFSCVIPMLTACIFIRANTKAALQVNTHNNYYTKLGRCVCDHAISGHTSHEASNIYRPNVS